MMTSCLRDSRGSRVRIAPGTLIMTESRNTGYIVKVRYVISGSNILLPFDLEDSSVMAVRRMSTGTRAVTLIYPEEWDSLMAGRLSGRGRLHFNYASRQFELQGSCLSLNRQFSDYLDADSVRVTNEKYIRIETFTARNPGRATRRMLHKP